MSEYQQTDWYDVPQYYDVVYKPGTTEEVDFLEAVLKRYAQSGGRQLLEPACGSGRLLVELARRGYPITGFDLNQAMLDYAQGRLREEGCEAELRQMDLSNFSFGARKFDLVYCLVSSMCHLLTEEEARQHLSRVADSLQIGGVYALGLLLTDYEDRNANMERFNEQRGDVQVTCNVKIWPANRRTRISPMRTRMIISGNGPIKRYESYWEMRTYGPRQLRSLLKSEPRLELVGCHTFDHNVNVDVPLGDDRLDKIVILRRR